MRWGLSVIPLLALLRCGTDSRVEPFGIGALLDDSDVAFVLLRNSTTGDIKNTATIDRTTDEPLLVPLSDDESLLLVRVSFDALVPTTFPLRPVLDPSEIELRLDGRNSECSAERYLEQEQLIDFPVPDSASFIEIDARAPEPRELARASLPFLENAVIRAPVGASDCLDAPLGEAVKFGAQTEVLQEGFTPLPHAEIEEWQARQFGHMLRLDNDRMLLISRGLHVIARGGTLTGTGSDSLYPDVDCPVRFPALLSDGAIDPTDPTRLAIVANAKEIGLLYEIRAVDGRLSCVGVEQFPERLSSLLFEADGRINVVGDAGYLASQDQRMGPFSQQPKPGQAHLRRMIHTGLTSHRYAIGTGSGEVLMGDPGRGWDTTLLAEELAENDISGLAAVATEEGIELWASRGQALAEIFRLPPGSLPGEWEEVALTVHDLAECSSPTDGCGHAVPKFGAKRLAPVIASGRAGLFFVLNSCSVPVFFDIGSRCTSTAVSGLGAARVTDSEGIFAMAVYDDAIYFGGKRGALYEVERR